MINVNVMRSFLNRLRDSGWKNINVRGNTYQDTQVLRRGNKSIICVENINVEASGDIWPQIDEFFKSLMETALKTDAKEIFLQGGNDFDLPRDFRDFCSDNGIKIHLITLKNYKEVIAGEI